MASGLIDRRVLGGVFSPRADCVRAGRGWPWVDPSRRWALQFLAASAALSAVSPLMLVPVAAVGGRLSACYCFSVTVRLRSAGTLVGYDPAAFRWRGIRPDGTPDEEMLQQLTSAIVKAVEPERIILFGSAARGEMRADSDLDVLVVKDGRHYRDVARAVYMCVPADTRAVDVVVATNDDIDRHRDKPYYVIQPALRDGRVLYEAYRAHA